jgi:hypothetical protein
MTCAFRSPRAHDVPPSSRLSTRTRAGAPSQIFMHGDSGIAGNARNNPICAPKPHPSDNRSQRQNGGSRSTPARCGVTSGDGPGLGALRPAVTGARVIKPSGDMVMSATTLPWPCFCPRARLLYLRAAEAGSHRPAGSAQRAGSTLADGTVSLTRVAATRIGPAATITVPARRAASGAARPGPRWCGR